MKSNKTENNLSDEATYNQLYVSITTKLNSGNYYDIASLLTSLSIDHPQRVSNDYTRFCLATARYYLGLDQFTETLQWLEAAPKKKQKYYNIIKALYLEKKDGLSATEETRIDSILRQAEKLCREDKYEAAYDMYTSHSKLYENRRLLLAFTQFLTSLGNVEEGRACYNILSNFMSIRKSPEMILLSHHLLRGEKKYSAAIRVLDKFLPENGDYRLKAFRARASCYVESGNLQAASDAFTTAFMMFPGDPTLHDNIVAFAQQYGYNNLLQMLTDRAPSTSNNHGSAQRAPSTTNWYRVRFTEKIRVENQANLARNQNSNQDFHHHNQYNKK